MTIRPNTDYYFSQNLTAAQEGALLARLNRAKLAINKYKVTLTTLEHGESQYSQIEDALLNERTKYYQILNQLNRVRARFNQEQITDDTNAIKQETRYVSDRDFYTPQFMSVSKQTSRFDYMYNGGNTQQRITNNRHTSIMDTASAM